VGTWHDPDEGRPIAAPLERCAELLGVDLATIYEAAANLEPYLRADGTRMWSLMQLERQLRPEAYGRRRGGYLDRRRIRPPMSSAVSGNVRPFTSSPRVRSWALRLRHGRVGHRALKYRARGSNV
jgi:hypothetical protein